MAISIVVGGSTIVKPSSVSNTVIDLGGGFPLGTSGLIAVIGEADAGAPGAQEINIADNRYNANQISLIKSKYRTGPIADSANFLFAPAADAAIPNGAQTVWFYKTNNSTRAALTLANSYGDVRSEEWGVGGNRITYTNTVVSEVVATHSGLAFDESALSGGETLGIRVDGGAENTFTAITVANNAALIASLADAGNWSAGIPAGVTVTVGGGDAASTITVTQDADATAHQNGYGHSFELSVATPLDLGLTSGLYTPSSESQVSILLDQKRDVIQESDVIGGSIAISIGSSQTVPTVNITSSAIELVENGTVIHTLLKSGFSTLKDIVEEINLASYAGWTAAIGDSQLNSKPASYLDVVSGVGASSATLLPARIKFDAWSVQDFFESASMAKLITPSDTGLPDTQAEIGLAGGTKGSTSSADIVAALEQFTKFHVNFIVPLFSRDATEDITDELTDSGSSYTIAGVHQAVKTHISLMKTTKRKSERQGYLAMKSDFTTTRDTAGDLADARIQLMFQDIRQADSDGVIKWFQPHALAAMMAGARSGASIGEPLTFKFMNISGLRHTAQPMTTADADINIDFDPDLQAEDAILAGMTFLESPTTGGFRCVVDNTTYGKDANWVLNRGSVIFAGDTVAYNFRNAMEAAFIGGKNTISEADVTSVASSVLAQFLSAGITVSTSDAPGGFKSLIVSIDGSTINIEFTVKLVEGIDFCVTNITVQRVGS